MGDNCLLLGKRHNTCWRQKTNLPMKYVTFRETNPTRKKHFLFISMNTKIFPRDYFMFWFLASEKHSRRLPIFPGGDVQQSKNAHRSTKHSSATSQVSLIMSNVKVHNSTTGKKYGLFGKVGGESVLCLNEEHGSTTSAGMTSRSNMAAWLVPQGMTMNILQANVPSSKTMICSSPAKFYKNKKKQKHVLSRPSQSPDLNSI